MLTAVQASRSEPKASEVHKGDFSPPAPARGRKEETQDRIVAASLALFALHDALVKDISDTLAAAGGESGASEALGAALVAMLDGNLLLALLDPNARNRDLRRAGLRRLVQLAIGAGGE